MDRLSFNQGELRGFIETVQNKLGVSTDALAKLIGVSGRTIRDWRREKFKPPQKDIIKMGEISEVQIPFYKILPPYWNMVAAGKLGGKKRYELYGLLGTIESRSRGGRSSWIKRKNNPELWAKYTKKCENPPNSEDLAELMGIILGDGGLTRYQCTIYLNSDTDREFAYYVSNLIQKLFGNHPVIYKSRRDKVWKVSVASVDLIKYLSLKGLSLGNKVHLQVGVPDWIWDKPEYIKACIRGLVDTDGCFFIHKYKVKGVEYCYPKINFSNRSEPLLNFVDSGLKLLGFNPKRTFEYDVWLHNHTEVRKYLKEIGTRNYKPAVQKILEGGPDGKAQVC